MKGCPNILGNPLLLNMVKDNVLNFKQSTSSNIKKSAGMKIIFPFNI